VVRAAADTAVSVPYLAAVLFVLGIRRDQVDAADDADGLEILKPRVG
jgi:phosphoserine phosphatase